MKTKIEISALTLHIIAMFCMLLDHLWATIIPGNMWMTYIGRLAFPIFAFLIVEGYFHTSNFNKYIKRLFLFAIISEIPYNLMQSGSVVDPFHQNVIWTFMISLICIYKIEKIKQGTTKKLQRNIEILGTILVSSAISIISMVDYSVAGLWMTLIFYFTYQWNYKNKIIQVIGMYFINFVFVQNMDIPFILFDHEFFFPTQGFAILSLVPIWMYHGKQGLHNKWIQYCCYSFYPLHILILSLLALR